MKNFDSIGVCEAPERREIADEAERIISAARAHKRYHRKCDDNCREFFKKRLPDMSGADYRFYYRKLCDALGV